MFVEKDGKLSLETELKYYNSKREELLQHYEGKYALIIGEELVGIFDDPLEGHKRVKEKRGNVPILVKRIAAEEPKGSFGKKDN